MITDISASILQGAIGWFVFVAIVVLYVLQYARLMHIQWSLLIERDMFD